MRTRLQKVRSVWLLGLIFLAVCAMSTTPVCAQQQTAGEAAGGGQEIRKEEDIKKGVNLCAGCLAPIYTTEGKGSFTPYGRIELDAIYSTRNTNPLDPAQFNGYGTAAGTQHNSSSTLNPRYSVFGLRADRTDGVHYLTGVVEMDFYGQTDNANNLPPRLRLAYMKYSPNNNKTTITIGQDWNPIMSLLNDDIDFSIMGYTGNLWNRLPQVTLRHNFTENVEWLVTAMRFERGLSNCCGNVQVRPTNTGTMGGGPTNSAPFNDPVQVPYFGTRVAYNGTGNLAGTMVAANVAYRWYRSAPTPASNILQTPGKDINSYVVGLEAVHQLTKQFKVMWDLAYGQALGNEWFRWNQDLNWLTGSAVRATTAWVQLSYAYSKNYTFLFGYGIDNPLDRDLKGSINPYGAGGVNSNIQYLSNQRTYLTVIRPIWADFYSGFEWQHFWTNWAQPTTVTSQLKNEANMFTLSAWYNF